jgi:hypothetical protein
MPQIGYADNVSERNQRGFFSGISVISGKSAGLFQRHQCNQWQISGAFSAASV